MCVAVHANTYQPQMFASYARLSSITEMDVMLAQQAQREVGYVCTVFSPTLFPVVSSPFSNRLPRLLELLYLFFSFLVI